MSAPRPLTRAWFRVGDTAARLLTFAAVLVAVAYPFLASEHATRRGLPMQWDAALVESLVWLAVAFGAHGFTRRRMVALLLIALPALRWAMHGQAIAAVAWLAVVVLVFVVPFILALRESHSGGGR